ncbi:MAG: radical SAM protein, partial [Azospira oryzae]
MASAVAPERKVFMTEWLRIVERVEALEDLDLDPDLVERMQRRYGALSGERVGTINFYTPTFKAFSTSEIAGCGKNAWPAVSITGGECKLACDHCKAKILEP